MLGKSAHGSSHKKKNSGGVVGVVRLFLSLIILLIMGLGLLLAFRNFSGVNPLNISPQQLAKSLVSADSAYALITSILTFSPTDSLSKAKGALTGEGNTDNDPQVTNEPTAPLAFSFAIIADPHKDMVNLKKALDQAKANDAKFIVGIGDFSDVGTDDELRNSKEQFDLAGLPYYTTPGDHDLWDSRDKDDPTPDTNFKEAFGNSYQTFAYDKVRFLMVYDSDNYNGLDQTQLSWVESELKKLQSDEDAKLIFVALATPLYHPSSDHVMGKVTPSLKNQASHLIDIFKKNGVDEVFAADTHYFTRYTEPTMDLKMTTSGAVTLDRNPQSPRFVMVDVFEDNTYQVKETPIQ
jgi:predicted phosphodiesterase